MSQLIRINHPARGNALIVVGRIADILRATAWPPQAQSSLAFGEDSTDESERQMESVLP